MDQPMIKEEAPKEAPPKDEPPLGTGIKGDGPDAYGLGDKAGNGRIGGGGDGSKWGSYSNQIGARIREALQRNPKTRNANFSIPVRVTADATGRLTRPELLGSTGDPTVDRILRDEILNGLAIPAPPPGYPPWVQLRVNAKRPR